MNPLPASPAPAPHPVRLYEYLTVARERIFDALRPLPGAQCHQPFPFGLNTINRTLTHIMIVEWSYTQRMQAIDVPPYEQWPIQDESPPEFAVIEATWRDQAPRTRAVLAAVRDWSADFQYISQSRDGVRRRVTATLADLFTQMFAHEIHHRAQVMAMIRQLDGAGTLQDVDYGYFTFRRDMLD